MKMRKAERVKFVEQTLQCLYPDPPIPLSHKDPYTLLVAVLLSAQCTDARVNEVTPKLFALADNPQDMALLPERKILSAVRVCGLGPTKAANIKKLSELLVERYDGVVPDTLEELEALPGVGHKTASVVVAQAFGKAAFPVDTHIHRCAKRWGLSSGKNVQQTERDLKRLFPEPRWKDLHLQIIYFAREYCPARQHDPESCPICSQI